MWERLLRIAAWIGGLALLGLVCQALGVDLRGWIEQLLDTVAEISAGYLVLGIVLQTVQTGLVAFAGSPSCAPRTRRRPSTAGR